jgi:hypothetical protein
VYKKLQMIVVDEVSMVRADLLDCVDRFLRLHGPRPHRPFGGVQMAFFGDLYQLPPVVTGPERKALEAVYETPYFYSARALQEVNLELVELEKVYRQTDRDFLEILGAIRNGTVADEHLALLNTRCLPEFEPGPEELYVQLTTTNRLAQAVNRAQLQKLTGRLARFEGVLQGEFGHDHAPAPLQLELKVGAQVMLVNNDPEGRWVNGTLGRVLEFPEGEEEPLVVVELEGGEVAEVVPYTWELFSFSVEDGELRSRVVGRYTQLPLMLAWAVTIHKSQGKTFDRVVIDVGHGAFAPGQVYVALSRCRTLEGVGAAPAHRPEARVGGLPDRAVPHPVPVPAGAAGPAPGPAPGDDSPGSTGGPPPADRVPQAQRGEDPTGGVALGTWRGGVPGPPVPGPARLLRPPAGRACFPGGPDSGDGAGGTGVFRSRTTAAGVVSGGGFRTPPPVCSQPSPVTFQ